jgi:hypothetical protein
MNLMMKKYLLIVIVIVFGMISKTNAQALGSDYKTAIGVKIYPGAISIKHFISSNVALEGLASFWRYGFRFTGLYEYHGEINDAPGLQWYIGPGAHIGFFNDRWSRRYIDQSNTVDFGIDGVLGLDYKIKGAPINVSLDWQPSFTIVTDPTFRSWGGLGVRFAF